jgi:hypothetical protein
MNLDDSQASACCCFQERYGILWKVVCGEETIADAAKEWHEEKLRCFEGISP